MFLRRLFSSSNKLTWVILDLAIVIFGVYIAFLIQSYAEERKTIIEREKVHVALKHEIEFLRYSSPKYADFMDSLQLAHREVLNKNTYVDFSGWIYIEPQYSFSITESVNNAENSSILDFELISGLQRLLSAIRRLEHSESLMMQSSLKYQRIPQDLQKDSPPHKLRTADNMQSFRWFITFSLSRMSTLNQVHETSISVLELINNRLPIEIRRSIEKEIILNRMEGVSDVEPTIESIKTFFPNFKEEEIREIYQMATERMDSLKAEEMDNVKFE